MKKLLQSLFVLLFFASTAIAQDRTITGTVTSSDDKLPIPGVSVRVTGTQIGTVTDANGKYSVKVPSGSKNLDFSFIGYLAKNVAITSSNTINVALESDSKTLSDVVVVGYGQQSKALTTQTTATVKAESFKNMPIQTPQQALQGQAAGVNMINSSGVLGSEAQITIRGGGSISAAGRPLYVVDGVPLNSSGGDYTQTQGGSSALNPLINISPNDIESMTVLKDASAVAIYGSRGANGVILITTKKGASGKTRISADYQNGFSSPTSVDEMMSADQFRQFRTDYLKANNQTVPTYPTTSYKHVHKQSGPIYAVK